MFRQAMHSGPTDASGISPKLPGLGDDRGRGPGGVAELELEDIHQALGPTAWAMTERVLPLEEKCQSHQIPERAELTRT